MKTVELTDEECKDVAEALAVIWEDVVKGKREREGFLEGVSEEEYGKLKRILEKFGVKCKPLEPVKKESFVDGVSKL